MRVATLHEVATTIVGNHLSFTLSLRLQTDRIWPSMPATRLHLPSLGPHADTVEGLHGPHITP